MSATILADDARFFLEQLSLPINPRDTIKARRERAINRSGLPPAKAYRIWYRQSVRLWQDEAHRLWTAYTTHVRRNEREAIQAKDELRSLREERFMKGLQSELDLARPEGLRQPLQNVAADEA